MADTFHTAGLHGGDIGRIDAAPAAAPVGAVDAARAPAPVGPGSGSGSAAPTGARPGGLTFAGDALEETLADRLSREIARYPLGAFASCLLVALAAYVFAVLVVPASPGAFDMWSAGAGRFSAAAAGLVALLCCGVADRADEHGATSTEAGLRRPLVALGLTAATLALLCARGLLLARYLGDPTITLGDAVRTVLTDPTTWVAGLATGAVLAAVAAPGAAGRLARSFVDVRRRRVQVLIAVALLVPAGVVLGSLVFVRALPGATPSSVMAGAPLLGVGDPLSAAAQRDPLPYAMAGLVCTLLLAVPLVFAWYGYAAPRLERRLSPLSVGVVIGAATAASSLALTQVVYRHYDISASHGIGVGFALVGDVALAVLAVRLRQLARGSLLPSAVLLATASTAFWAFAWWPGAVRGRVVTGEKAYAWALIGLAVVVVAQASLWRRDTARHEDVEDRAGPEGAPVPARPPAPPTAYDVVVKDLGMPAAADPSRLTGAAPDRGASAGPPSPASRPRPPA